MMKKGKSKDSCDSKVYIVEGGKPDFSKHTPIENDIDIEKLLRNDS